MYFDHDGTDIGPGVAGMLDNVAAILASSAGQQIVISGHADRSEEPAVEISQRRANSVRDYLAARGVSLDRMTTEAFREGRPRVETADGVREPQNRRVEIVLAPQSSL
jgi:OOP family OmpA-OmpF porin